MDHDTLSLLSHDASQSLDYDADVDPETEPDDDRSFYDDQPSNRSYHARKKKSSSEQKQKTSSSTSSKEPKVPAAPWYAWAALIVACICMAAVGPAFKYLQQRGITPLLSAVWRTQSMLLFLVPPLCIELYRQTRSLSDRAQLKAMFTENRTALWCTLLGGCFWGLSLALWVVALLYTTAVRSSLFSALYPALIVLVYRVKGISVSRGEIVGVMLAMCGVCVSMMGAFTGWDPLVREHSEHEASSSPESSDDAWIGDMMCLSLSVILCLEIFLSATARKEMPLFLYTATSTVCCLFLLCFLTIAFEGATLDADPIHGLFGWLDTRWVLMMLIFGFLVGLVGILGFNIAIAHISPLVFAIVQLSDPVLVVFMTWLTGIEGPPGLWTYLGGLVLLTGTAVSIVCEDMRKRRAAAAEAALAAAEMASDDQAEGDVHMEDDVDGLEETASSRSDRRYVLDDEEEDESIPMRDM
jgi:drug/metabolite transporter (DMT)-like permease